METYKKATQATLTTSPKSGRKKKNMKNGVHDGKRVPYQSLSFIEKLRHAGPFCRSREWVEKYKLTVCKQLMANYSYFVNMFCQVLSYMLFLRMCA